MLAENLHCHKKIMILVAVKYHHDSRRKITTLLVFELKIIENENVCWQLKKNPKREKSGDSRGSCPVMDIE